MTGSELWLMVTTGFMLFMAGLNLGEVIGRLSP